MSDEKMNTLVTESDAKSLEHLTNLLRENPLISEVSIASTPDEALLKLIDTSPDLIFTEYPFTGKVGPKLLNYVQSRLPMSMIVYTSESRDYALNAIQDGVFNFLVKPIQEPELLDLIDKAITKRESNIQNRFKQFIEKTPEEFKLKLQTPKGYLLLKPDEILCCTASGVYTELTLTQNRKELVYLMLAKMEKNLLPYNFVRISRSVIVNPKHIRKIYRPDNTVVLSSDGKEYEVKGSKLQVRNLGRLDNE